MQFIYNVFEVPTDEQIKEVEEHRYDFCKKIRTDLSKVTKRIPMWIVKRSPYLSTIKLMSQNDFIENIEYKNNLVLIRINDTYSNMLETSDIAANVRQFFKTHHIWFLSKIIKEKLETSRGNLAKELKNSLKNICFEKVEFMEVI